MATNYLNMYNKRLGRGGRNVSALASRHLASAGYEMTKKGHLSSSNFKGKTPEQLESMIEELNGLLPRGKKAFTEKYTTSDTLFQDLFDEYYEFTIQDGVEVRNKGGYGDTLREQVGRISGKVEHGMEMSDYWEKMAKDFAKRGNAKELSNEDIREGIKTLKAFKSGNWATSEKEGKVGQAVWDESRRKWRMF